MDEGLQHNESGSAATTETGAEWRDICAEDEVWQGEMRSVRVGETDVLLLGLEVGILAYEDKCPHNGGLLSKGEFCDGIVVCTRHQWEFCAATGGSINPVGSTMKGIPIRVVSGRIEVKVEDQAGN